MVRSILGLVFGIGFLICGGLSASYTRDFVQSSVVVPGRVIELNAGPRHPEIEFFTREGKRIRFPEGGFIPEMHVGDRVQVRYRPGAALQTARADVFGAVWSMTIFFFMMGGVFSIVSIINIILEKRTTN